jgi:hypothetical protein
MEDIIRDLGDAGGETEARVPAEDGEVARAACELEVAWCLSEGGEVAIALAFARLAAIAAAILVFFVVGVEG